jgi:ribonuclease BN (tRNA processing enzyme)
MRITFLGSGGAFCDHRVNYQNNAVVWTSEGPVLLDCGTTAVQSLKELGVSRAAVQAVLFTHLHGDHASPEMLVWERVYGEGPDGGPAFLRTPLCGPADLVEPLLGALRPYLDPFADRDGVVRRGGVEALVEPRIGAVLEVGDTRFTWFRVPHVVGPEVDKPAYGIEVRQGGQSVLWSGDTTLSPRWLLDAAARPDVLRIFHECLFHPWFPSTVHTHWEELQRLPEAVQRRITLMHHTAVPAGTELMGFAGAAARHQDFRW